MTSEKFNELVDYIFEEKVKKTMCSKSAEYARGGDKLHNFYRAGEVDNISAIEALRGMDLKHRVSISDMLDDIKEDESLHFPRALWEEKIIDDINYSILLLALLAERDRWEI
jgi:hypothetical protein